VFCNLQLTDTSGLTKFKKVLKVRILLAPPRSLNCRQSPPPVPAKCAKHARIPHISSSNRIAENGLPVGKGALVPPFLRRAHAQSGFETSCRRMQCDQKPMKRRSPGLYSFVHKAVFTAIAKYGHYSRISAQSERKFSAVQTFTLHGGSERDSSSVRIGRLHGGNSTMTKTYPLEGAQYCSVSGLIGVVC